MQDQQEYDNAHIFTYKPEGFWRRYPAIAHAALVSVVLLPIGLLPYVLARRQINILRRMTEKQERKTTILQNTLHLTSDTHNIMKSEVKRLQDLSQETIEATAALRREISQQKAEHRQSHQTINADLKTLLKEAQNARYVAFDLFRAPINQSLERAHAASLHALGTSLADIAAFMQEVELDFGMNLTQHTDRLGVERLRILARRMQSIQVDNTHQQVIEDDRY